MTKARNKNNIPYWQWTDEEKIEHRARCLSFYHNNKERLGLSYKDWPEERKERHKASTRRYAEENKEKNKERSRLYYLEHKEEILARNKETLRKKRLEKDESKESTNKTLKVTNQSNYEVIDLRKKKST
jgi:hypothetical protein